MEEAQQQGLSFYDGDGDSLMSRTEYEALQAGTADVFGAADQAGAPYGAVQDELITQEEAENQGLIFVDANADGYMSRLEHEQARWGRSQALNQWFVDSEGQVRDLSREEAFDLGLTFFDGNGDRHMSRQEFLQVIRHEVGGIRPRR